MTNQITEILNEIYKIEGYTLVDKIIGYCEKNNLDPKEIGDILEESEQFKRKLYIDLVHHKAIKDPKFVEKEELCEILDVW